MKHPLRLLLVVAFVVFGWWLWNALFPNPKTVIRKQLTELAHVASFKPNEGNVTRLANVVKLANFFADQVEIKIDLPGPDLPSIGSRDDLKAAALAARSSGRTVEAEFLDINVQIMPDKDSALANLTVRAKISGEADLFIEEMQFNLKKIEGNWLITRVQSVKTLR